MTSAQPLPSVPPPDFLKMSGIGKSFSGVSVLEGVSWSLRPGEVHMLAGELLKEE